MRPKIPSCPLHAIALIGALCVVPAIVAQWQVDHRVPGGISGMGTMRHVQSASRALPSESRFEQMSSGLLPSENRTRYLDAGPGISHARLASPPGAASYRPPDPYASMSSIRYGGMTPGTVPGPRPAAPIAPYPSAAAPFPKPGGGTRQHSSSPTCRPRFDTAARGPRWGRRRARPSGAGQRRSPRRRRTRHPARSATPRGFRKGTRTRIHRGGRLLLRE
jgi:hypothetical protein